MSGCCNDGSGQYWASVITISSRVAFEVNEQIHAGLKREKYDKYREERGCINNMSMVHKSGER
ncbi:Lipopolysaccharide-responsive and beige-like anchor protein [Bienertia sinuspersici]